MRKLFYPRLAAQNIRKNRRFYYPYLLTGTLTVAMFYNVRFLTTSQAMHSLPSAMSLISMMAFGSAVVAIFSLIFLLYTNSFLMKRRQKELGLYNVLGMGKRHIGRILLWETIYTYLIHIVGGLLIGMLFSKLLVLLVCRLLFFDVAFGFEVSTSAVTSTIGLFAVIEALALVGNLVRTRLAKPVELLRGGNTGEREPRTKWVLAALGVLLTGIGYGMALTVESPIAALSTFFVAVLLVIFGTYCLFTAGSIAVLKLLRRNKKFYYQTRHFTAVSGMLYRMKQNAVGLASICILCTMVLVTVSTTVCLYSGTEGALDERYPQDISLTASLNDPETDTAAIHETVLTEVKNAGRSIERLHEYSTLSFAAVQNGSAFALDPAADNLVGAANVSALSMMTDTQFAALTGEAVSLQPDETMVYFERETTEWPTLTVDGSTLRVTRWLSDYPQNGEYAGFITNVYYLVVPETVFSELNARQQLAYGDDASTPNWYLQLDLDGTDDEIEACYHNIRTALLAQCSVTTTDQNGQPVVTLRGMPFTDCRQVSRGDFYATYGGLLFLGLFLGALFLMATVLIIYYKQISEGYEDHERFAILQQVGMTRDEVRRSINSQVRLVFFLPLVVAVCHLFGSFHMMSKLLSLLNLTNLSLFVVCTLITIAVFALGYALVYYLTSRTYYKIVSDTQR